MITFLRTGRRIGKKGSSLTIIKNNCILERNLFVCLSQFVRLWDAHLVHYSAEHNSVVIYRCLTKTNIFLTDILNFRSSKSVFVIRKALLPVHKTHFVKWKIHHFRYRIRIFKSGIVHFRSIKSIFKCTTSGRKRK